VLPPVLLPKLRNQSLIVRHLAQLLEGIRVGLILFLFWSLAIPAVWSRIESAELFLSPLVDLSATPLVFSQL
jgi:hypothetical protein